MKFTVISVMIAWKLAGCQRRILNGAAVKDDKPYMVYLLKAPESHATYRGWLCGGAIIHPLHILTSSTCVMDVYNVYVISGWRYYVNEKDIDLNLCIKKTKKRIVSLCEIFDEDWRIYQAYTYNGGFDNTDKESTYWAVDNIGLARVDTPFDFYGDGYNACHYRPKIISVNFLDKYVTEGTEAIALGWGNTRFYRPLGDKQIFNSYELLYTSTLVYDPEACREKYFASDPNWPIKKDENRVLCTFYGGTLDSNGIPKDVNEYCYDCEEPSTEPINGRKWWVTDLIASKTVSSTTPTWLSSYGYGICQNDQGGPLVTWIGGRETIIGVNSAFLVTEMMECKGPFVYANTCYKSKLLYCVMSTKVRRVARDCEEYAKELGLKIIEHAVHWVDPEDHYRRYMEHYNSSAEQLSSSEQKNDANESHSTVTKEDEAPSTTESELGEHYRRFIENYNSSAEQLEEYNITSSSERTNEHMDESHFTVTKENETTPTTESKSGGQAEATEKNEEVSTTVSKFELELIKALNESNLLKKINFSSTL